MYPDTLAGLGMMISNVSVGSSSVGGVWVPCVAAGD